MNGANERSDRVRFSLPFRSAMSEAERALLRSQLGMTTHSHPKHPAVDPPLGFAPLDAGSGLYLVGQGSSWAIECRTWGCPSDEQVRRWYLMATHVIGQLDPNVSGTIRSELDAGPVPVVALYRTAERESHPHAEPCDSIHRHGHDSFPASDPPPSWSGPDDVPTRAFAPLGARP